MYIYNKKPCSQLRTDKCNKNKMNEKKKFKPYPDKLDVVISVLCDSGIDNSEFLC